MTIILALLLLCILITVHEWGHFTAARITGIPVSEFAIGFGPKILSWKSKKYDTAFSLRIFPLGGYCAFVGEDDKDGAFVDNPDAYNRQNVWKRIFTVIMGPMMNFVLAVIVAIAYFTLSPAVDIVPDSVHIQAVEQGSPADAAGILPGDQVILVGDKTIDLSDSSALVTALNAQFTEGANVSLTVKRKQDLVVLTVIPRLDETDNVYRIGVSIAPQVTEPYQLAFPVAISRAWDYCLESATLVFRSLKMLFTSDGLQYASGPVGVVAAVAEQTSAYGASAYISLLIMISINLGIMNLLPIPGLDGSRLLFMLVEAIRHKPINQQKEAMVHLAGFLLLFGLMLVLTFKDIARLLT